MCPRCRTDSARPERIAQENDVEARVVLRCHSCRHRWSEIFTVDESWPALRRQLLRPATSRDPA
jgi:hypothetical protein